MWKLITARWQQGFRTMAHPGPQPPSLPDRLRGRPEIDETRCGAECEACAQACPTDAIEVSPVASQGEATSPRRVSLRVDMGRCLFCTACTDACPSGAMTHSTDHRLAARRREDLWVTPNEHHPAGDAAKGTPKSASRTAIDIELESRAIATRKAMLDERLRRMFGRSLKLRQVSAGGCNACEADINVLSTIGFDLGRFGIQVVASPRHADGVLITGPVTANMKLALEKTWDAIPSPKIAVAVGACAISGGPYVGHPESNDGAGKIVPIDLWIPGCPPHPLTILDGLLAMLDRLEKG